MSRRVIYQSNAASELETILDYIDQRSNEKNVDANQLSLATVAKPQLSETPH